MSASDSTNSNPHHHSHRSWYPPNASMQRYPPEAPSQRYPSHAPPQQYPPEAPSQRYPPVAPPPHYPPEAPPQRYTSLAPPQQYPTEAPQQQAPIHSKHNFYNSSGGNRAPSSDQYPHYPQNNFVYGHHQPVPYPHHRYPYPYEGSDEVLEDANSTSEQPSNSNRRDSFPYYHNIPVQQQATPLQPPANFYNGPPVSALVPRFPRGSAMMYTQQGYTPNHIHFDSSNSMNPPSAEGGIDSAAKGYMYSKGRRTSFGFPMISSNPHFLIPTPQEHSTPGDANDTSSETSSPVIPVPPLKDGNSTSNHGTDLKNQPSEFMNQETRCLNLLSKKFESSNTSPQWTASVTNIEIVGDVPKKPPSVQDASLLLGLSSDASNNSSPATVPTLKDEAECSKIDVKVKQQENLPKTSFPVPIPKNYPRRLSLPNDSIKLNALHCFVRSELLEIFVVEPTPEGLKYKHAPSSSVGRVGLRCVHCFLARRNTMNASRDEEAPMSVFYPKTVSEIYRLVTSWQRCHVRKCKNLPKDVRDKWHSLRETEKSRGKTAYWVESAKIIGLVDCTSRMGGICFDIPQADQEAVDNLLGIKVEFDGKALDENSEPSTSNAATAKEKSLSLNGSMAISTPLASSTNADKKMF